MANGKITVINNTQSGLQILVSNNGSKWPDGQVVSGFLESYTSSGFAVDGSDLYQVGFINGQDPNYQYGYIWTKNVKSDGTVMISAVQNDMAEQK